MNLNESLKVMSDNSKGYCLWVGAGLSLHLAGVGKVPLWPELVEDLRSETDIKILEGGYPEQLSQLLEAVGRKRFQRYLRKNLLERMSSSIVDLAKEYRDPASCIPPQVRQIAQLGMLANPIVNFNIETLTSILLARPGGAYEVKYFIPIPKAVRGIVKNNYSGVGGKFRRHVLHPHGAIDHSGICIMTSEEYEILNESLAFQLAIHSSFASNLAIVGMSLEDRYLRNQISKFREQIGHILWFVENHQIDKEVLHWAHANRVDVIEISSWDQFWKIIGDALPQPKEIDLLNTWESITRLSLLELSTSFITFAIDNLGKDTPENVRNAYIQYRDNVGENPDNKKCTLGNMDYDREVLRSINEAIKIHSNLS